MLGNLIWLYSIVFCMAWHGKVLNISGCAGWIYKVPKMANASQYSMTWIIRILIQESTNSCISSFIISGIWSWLSQNDHGYISGQVTEAKPPLQGTAFLEAPPAAEESRGGTGTSLPVCLVRGCPHLWVLAWVLQGGHGCVHVSCSPAGKLHMESTSYSSPSNGSCSFPGSAAQIEILI